MENQHNRQAGSQTQSETAGTRKKGKKGKKNKNK